MLYPNDDKEYPLGGTEEYLRNLKAFWQASEVVLDITHKHSVAPILIFLYGSRLYGLHREDSDYEFIVVYIEPIENFFRADRKPRMRLPHAKIGENIEYNSYEAIEFIREMLRSNPTVLEVSRWYISWYMAGKGETFLKLYDKCLKFVNLGALARHYIGMAHSICKRFLVGKASIKPYHAYRCLYNILYILEAKSRPVNDTVSTIKQVHSYGTPEKFGISWLKKEEVIKKVRRITPVSKEDCNKILESLSVLYKILKEKDFNVVKPTKEDMNEINSILYRLHRGIHL